MKIALAVFGFSVAAVFCGWFGSFGFEPTRNAFAHLVIAGPH